MLLVAELTADFEGADVVQAETGVEGDSQVEGEAGLEGVIAHVVGMDSVEVQTVGKQVSHGLPVTVVAAVVQPVETGLDDHADSSQLEEGHSPQDAAEVVFASSHVAEGTSFQDS